MLIMGPKFSGRGCILYIQNLMWGSMYTKQIYRSVAFDRNNAILAAREARRAQYKLCQRHETQKISLITGKKRGSW